MSVYDELFDDQQVVRQIRQKLPHLFLLAELTGEALRLLVKDASTRKIDIDFPHEQLDYKEAYKRWLDAWRET